MTPAPNPATPTTAVLVDDLARYRVLPVERVTNLLAEFPGGGADALAEYLVRRGALTDFQATRALAGQARALALGPYVLTGVHGSGSLGPVFRGLHRTTPGAFVVRVLPLRSLWAARQAKQLAKALGPLAAHPGLVPLADADSAHGFHYLVWPLVEGDRLGDRVRAAGPLPPPVAARVLTQLADALAACHARQVTHGLLTPLAVALGAADRPKLLEVGAGMLLARSIAADEPLFDTLSAAVAVDNELDYAAPEVIADPTRISAGGDLFSLGAVGYFALTGRPPFPPGYVTDRLLAKQIAPPPPVREVNPAVPVELAEVVEQLLRLNPAERLATAEDVRDLLAEVADRLDPPPREPPPAGPDLPDAGDRPARFDPLASIPPDVSVRRVDFGSVVARISASDDTDASVRFDLTDEGSPDAAFIRPVDTPSRAGIETRFPPPGTAPDVRLSARPALPSPQPPTSSPPAEPPPEDSDPDLSPAYSDGPTMAKSRLLNASLTGGTPLPVLPALPLAPADPRSTMPKPVKWHVTPPAGSAAVPAPAGRDADLPVAEPDGQPANSVLWKRMKRSLLFWQAPTDPVQVSVFGPTATAPGQSAKLTVFLHPPEASDNVHTLSRAFHHDAEPIGTGFVSREVARDSTLAVHLAIANAGVSRSLYELVWRGQPHRLTFDLHVPWESPSGPAPGLVSVGVGNVRIGKIPFRVNVLPRKG